MDTPCQYHRCLGELLKDTRIGRDGRNGDPTGCQSKGAAIGHDCSGLDDCGNVIGGLAHAHKNTVVNRVEGDLLLFGQKALDFVGPIHLRQDFGRRQTPEPSHSTRRAKGTSLFAANLGRYTERRLAPILPWNNDGFDFEAVRHELQQQLCCSIRGDGNLRELCYFFFDTTPTDCFQELQRFFAQTGGRTPRACCGEAFLDLLPRPSRKEVTCGFFTCSFFCASTAIVPNWIDPHPQTVPARLCLTGSTKTLGKFFKGKG
mmetsp:Transcript_9903/g.24684  ORF Transcript_9903/g.24684 Transcript_9903/m.24684 type:complete len:260 (+) Transcript_9903:345-1124(+)